MSTLVLGTWQSLIARMPRKLASHVKGGTVSDTMRNEKVTIRLDKVAATDNLGESSFMEAESQKLCYCGFKNQ